MADIFMTVVDAVKTGILDVAANGSAVAGNAAGTDDFFFANDGKTVLACAVGAAAKQLVFTAVPDKYGRTETLSPTPTASKQSIIGPFPPELFNHPGGYVKFKPAAGGLVTDLYLAVRVKR